MRIYHWPLVVFALLLAACSHSTEKVESSNVKKSDGYEAALEKAFAEIAEYSTPRNPAAAPAGINLRELGIVKPGKFKIYVFPVLRSQTLKSTDDDEPLFKTAADEARSRLGPPLEYEVSTIAENPCVQFIERGLFAKHNPKQFFDPALAKNNDRRCAIVEVTAMRMKSADRSLIKRDDMLKTTLFLDDAYMLHGYEVEKFVSGRETKTVRVKTSDAQLVSTSGLTLFPVDIPTVEILGRPNVRQGQLEVARKLGKMGLAQIRKKYMRSFATSDCKGVEAVYTDYYGSRVSVGWCEGLPFPQYMENGRFLAITQPLSVR